MDDDAESERDYAQIKEDVLGELKQAFKPEFLNRVDEIIVDVYKRQVSEYADYILAGSEESGLLKGILTVSYTHLDVYKRQII